MAASHSRDAGKRVRASLPAPKRRIRQPSCPSFWIPWEIKMLGGSKFRLRQDFCPREKCLHGAGAPPALWAGNNGGELAASTPRRRRDRIRGEAGGLRMAASHSRDAGKRVRASLPAPKRRIRQPSCPSFWIPWEIKMLGGSKFRLRQDFCPWQKCLHGAGAPPVPWAGKVDGKRAAAP